jgi:adenylate cyclase
MNADMSVAQRLGRVLEAVTRQSGRLSKTPAYGSWLLGKVAESPGRRRVRIQVIMTVFIVTANVIGIGVVLMLVTVAFPAPSIFTDAPPWIAAASAWRQVRSSPAMSAQRSASSTP